MYHPYSAREILILILGKGAKSRQQQRRDVLYCEKWQLGILKA
jgi:hypothetical protein